MSRDRGVDGLRAYAIGGVVLGHWLVTGLVLTPAGALTTFSPLAPMPWLVPVTWLLQTLGLFFFTAGYASARSLRSGGGRAEPTGLAGGGGDASHTTIRDGAGGYRHWFGGRLRRLVGPVASMLGCWAAVLAAALITGAPTTTLRTVATLVVSPLWFLLPFLALVLLTGPLRRALHRYGTTAVVLPPLALVATVDLTGRLRPGGVPGWLVPVGVLGAWLVPYLLGIALADGRGTGRRTGAWLTVAGVAGMTTLVLGAGYPASAVGVPGAGRSNLDPPSLFTVCLALAQIGAALLLRPWLNRLLDRPVWWRPVRALNAVALPVYLWHQTALVTVTVLAARLAGGTPLPGLHTVPAQPGWVAARLAWLPLAAAVLAALVTSAGAATSRWSRNGHDLDRDAGRAAGPRQPSVARGGATRRPAGRAADNRPTSPHGGAGVRSLRPGPVRQVEVIAVRDSDPPSRGRAARQSR